MGWEKAGITKLIIGETTLPDDLAFKEIIQL